MLVCKLHMFIEEDYICPECFYNADKPCKDRNCQLFEDSNEELDKECK